MPQHSVGETCSNFNVAVTWLIGENLDKYNYLLCAKVGFDFFKYLACCKANIRILNRICFAEVYYNFVYEINQVLPVDQ